MDLKEATNKIAAQGELVLHDGRHVLGGSVTVVDGIAQLVDVSGRCIHQVKEATHGILADQRFRCCCGFGFAHL